MDVDHGIWTKLICRHMSWSLNLTQPDQSQSQVKSHKRYASTQTLTLTLYEHKYVLKDVHKHIHLYTYLHVGVCASTSAVVAGNPWPCLPFAAAATTITNERLLCSVSNGWAQVGLGVGVGVAVAAKRGGVVSVYNSHRGYSRVYGNSSSSSCYA